MRLSGIEIRNFRSVGEKPVMLAPWKKCNILVGKNNCGKSNIIRAVRRISELAGLRNQVIAPANRHKRSEEYDVRFVLTFDRDEADDAKRNNWLVCLPVTFELTFAAGGQGPEIDSLEFHGEINPRTVTNILRALTRYNRESVGRKFIDEELFKHRDSLLNGGNFLSNVPSAETIPEFRKIQVVENGANLLQGDNLIELLAEFQHPEENKDEDRKKFDQVQEFVRRLLHLPDAHLEVTPQNNLLLYANGLRLPLSDYGTGVHELVILITAVLSLENSLICIEEPEIHLHPTLQREFIEFITVETSNQYLISTHSPTLINAHTTMCADARNNIQVFHLYLDKQTGSTVGGPVLHDEHSLIALGDLGIRASDILQSNCVIWVEGPSDRVYLNHWLRLVAPELIEGLHYSIMFYGGRLLSHLSVKRFDVPEELIEILRVNQRAIVVIDDDRTKPRQRLAKNKKRVKEECEATGSLCWITDGREIENYLPEQVVRAACQEIVEKEIAFSIGQYDKFEDNLSVSLQSARAKRVDYAKQKVKYARIFIEYFGLEDISPDLEKRLEQVAKQIHEWNC